MVKNVAQEGSRSKSLTHSFAITVVPLNVREIAADTLRIFISGLLRIALGKEWRIKHKTYGVLELLHHHFIQDRLRYHIVRYVGDNFAQIKLDGSTWAIIPRDSLCIIRDILHEQIYDKYYKLTDNDVVIDVGAHVGIFTLKATQEAKLVIAVEPEPHNYRLLKYNVTMNNISNAICLNTALANFNGYIDLYIDRNSLGHSVVPELRKRFVSKRKIRVKAMKLDSLVKELGLEKVDFIKIDVEGAELNVLEGALETLRSFNPFLSIAAYHYKDEYIEIYRFLKKIGYRCIYARSFYYPETIIYCLR